MMKHIVHFNLALLCIFLFYSSILAQQEHLEYNIFTSQQEPSKSLLQLKSKYNEATENHKTLAAAQALQQMGLLCFHVGHYPQALDFYLQADKLFKSIEADLLRANNLNDLGLLQYFNRNPVLARQYYEEALHLFESHNDHLGIAITLGKIGHLFEKQQDYNRSLDFQKQAIQHYTQINNQTGIAKIYENLGSIFEDLSRYDSAKFYFNKSLKINDEQSNEVAKIEVLNNIGDILRKTGKPQEGLTYSKQALSLSKKYHEKYQEASAYRDLARTFNLLGQNDSAYFYLEISRKMTLDIYSEQSNQKMAMMQAIYDITKKNSEIERLNNNSKTNKIIGFAATIVMLLLAILGGVVINKQRIYIQNEHLVNEQKRKVFEKEQELVQVALRNRQLEEEQLKQELEIKSRDLTTHTLHIIQKNQVLEKLYQRLEEISKDDRKNTQRNIQKIMTEIQDNFNHDQHWDEFRQIFEQVHGMFLEKVRASSENLTANDLRLIALLKMNLKSSEIASLLGISQDSLRVIRYRLRKKLNMEQGDNLASFMQNL
jgi:tetratricopeptide (TPR) repeat protein